MKRRSKTASAAQPAESTPAAGAPAAVAESMTLAHLQTAYNGERNASVRYQTFAKEADEEGHAPVASLFRAAARSEEVHANNHAEVIHQMGGVPQANLEAVIVKSTRDNLETAIKGEVYERDEMYPAFLHQARLEGNRAAARTFQLAQRVEAEHANLFTEALNTLDHLRGDAVTYYVCPVCGFTSTRNDRPRCPICANPSDQYLKVS